MGDDSSFSDKVLRSFNKDKFALAGSNTERLKQEIAIANSDGGHYWITLYKRITDGFRGNKNNINSLLAYCVDVTDCPPDLSQPFSPRKDYVLVRFSQPDIDCDFEDNGEIFDYLREKYGESRVGNIGTYAGMKIKSAFQNSAKYEKIEGNHLNLIQGFFLPNYDSFERRPKSWEILKKVYDGLPQEGKNSFEQTIADSARLLTKILDLDSPEGSGDTSNMSWADIVEDKAINNALKEIYPGIFKRAAAAYGSLIHKGSHAAGVVIVDTDIDGIIPMHWVGTKDKRRWATQWDMNDVEALGYLKFDVLGVKSLEILHKAVTLAEQRMIRGGSVGSEFKIDIYKLKKNEDSCDKIMKLFEDGKTAGIFQFDGGGMTSFVKKMKPERFEDLVAATALFRPGPIKNGFHEDYIKNKNGDFRWKNTVVNQAMFDLLSPTHGLFVYQEQIMAATKILAGFTSSEADELRKIIGKKLLSKMGPMRKKFVDRAIIHGVVSGEAADFYWNQFEKFGSYCFNLAHSSAYSLLSYRLSYMKANFPTEFYCGLLSCELRYGNAQKSKDNMERYKREAKSFGIKFIKPNINTSLAYDFLPEPSKDSSGNETGVDSKVILQPIAIVDAIGEMTAETICRSAPYESFNDFIMRSGVGAKLFTDLLETGIFDCWLAEFDSKSSLIAHFEQFHSRLKNKKKPSLRPPNLPGLKFGTIKSEQKVIAR